MDLAINKIVDIVLAFNKETSYDRLLDVVLTELMEFTNSEAGTLYTLEGDALHFRISKNHALNISSSLGDAFDLPPIVLNPDNIENISAYAAINNETILIDDVYNCDRFNFSGPQKFDKITGYRTCSMLVFPLRAQFDEQEKLVGVIQLINAMDMETGKITAFKGIYDPPQFFPALSGIAAIALANLRHRHELKKAMEDMRRVEIAEEANRAKSQFLAQISHEIRTPLNSILGITEIQLGQAKSSEETTEAFLRIHNSSNLLLELINNLLDLSKVEADKMEIIARPYAVSNLIIDVVHMNLVHTVNKQLDFSVKVDSKLPLILMGSMLRIKQVLNNVLSNAFKYTDFGSVELSFICGPELGEPCDIEGINLTISVKDTGKGMTAGQVRQLFGEEYIRFNEREHIQGTGLGMSITHKLVTLMGGVIAVESAPDEGTCVTVQIPQKVEGEGVIGEDAAKSLQNYESTQSSQKWVAGFAHEPMPYGRIMVVDDQESNLYVAKGLFSPYKLTVETAVSGLAAIEKVAAGEVYDVIFMDHMMPDMDGVEAVKILRKMGYEHPIVALTANAIIGQDEMFMQNGFSDFISKPVDTRILDACLNHFVRKKQPPKIIKSAKLTSEPSRDAPKHHDVPVEHFLRDADKVVVTLDAFVQQQSFDAEALRSYILSVHSMKNLLASLGESELANRANALENAGRNADIEAIKADAPALLACFCDFVEMLKVEAAEELKEVEGDDGAPEDLEYLRMQLSSIQAACEDYDKMGAESAMDALMQKPRSKQTKLFLREVSLLLLRGDYEDAAALANQTVKALL
ncbi:MAG: ATP-binding protein [Oscillospiraceae bacterium]|nr:ATP-binding protein [Oscillospiraceae bacterium]